MNIAERFTDRLVADALEDARKAGIAVPVSEVADEIIEAVGLPPARRAELIQRIATECVARGLIVELRNTRGAATGTAYSETRRKLSPART